MIPLLLWILSPHFPWQGSSGEQELLASVLFVLASITDGVDGYLARKRGQITTMGMLLDPLADKIMVTGAIIALVAYNPQVVKVWIAVVIIGREFLISGLRSIAASEGFTIQASDLGKLKTVTQIVSVVSAILAHHWYQWQIGVADPSCEVDRGHGHLLHGGGVDHLRHRLLRRFLETDRPRLQGPAQHLRPDPAQKRQHAQRALAYGFASVPRAVPSCSPQGGATEMLLADFRSRRFRVQRKPRQRPGLFVATQVCCFRPLREPAPEPGQLAPLRWLRQAPQPQEWWFRG